MSSNRIEFPTGERYLGGDSYREFGQPEEFLVDPFDRSEVPATCPRISGDGYHQVKRPNAVSR